MLLCISCDEKLFKCGESSKSMVFEVLSRWESKVGGVLKSMEGAAWNEVILSVAGSMKSHGRWWGVVGFEIRDGLYVGMLRAEKLEGWCKSLSVHSWRVDPVCVMELKWLNASGASDSTLLFTHGCAKALFAIELVFLKILQMAQESCSSNNKERTIRLNYIQAWIDICGRGWDIRWVESCYPRTCLVVMGGGLWEV